MTRTVKLGDVCAVQNGFAFDSSRFNETAGFPLLRIRDLKTNRPSVRFDGPYLDQYVVDDGDLLIGMDGEFVPYTWSGGKALLNQRVCRLVPDPSALSRVYLSFALLGPLRRIEDATSLTTVKHLSSRSVVAIELELPTLDEQHRIAVRLTAEFAATDRLRDGVGGRARSLAALRARAFDEAFGAGVPLSIGPAQEGRPGWRWRLLTDWARLESGHTPSRRHPEWWDGDVPWIQLADIRAADGAVIDETSERTNLDGIANSAARILPAGTVVMSRTASVGFVAQMGRDMATSQDFVNWVCGPDLDPRFLMYLLMAARGYIRSLSSGAIHKTVYYPTVKQFRVCAPPIAEQRRVVRDLEAHLKAIDRAAEATRVQRSAIEALPGAVLREAFADVA